MGASPRYTGLPPYTPRHKWRCCGMQRAGAPAAFGPCRRPPPSPRGARAAPPAPAIVAAPLLRCPRAALAPLRCACVAGPGGARRGRRRFAAPLRRPALRRGRAALAAPPLPRSARVRRCAAPWALAGPDCPALGPVRRWARLGVCGPPRRVSGRGRWAARGPAGGLLRARCFRPLAPRGRAASGPAAPAPAPRRPLGRLFPLRGPGLFAARARLRALAALLRPRCLGFAGAFSGSASLPPERPCSARPGALHFACGWGSPLPPPRPAAPAGGSREREARWGLRPRSGSRFSRPCRGPHGALRAPPVPLFRPG